MYISVVITLSRPNEVTATIANLGSALTSDDTYELIVGIDNKDILTEAVDYALLFFSLQDRFRNIEYVETFNKKPPEKDMDARQLRIAALHNLIRERVGGSDFVFGFEDDSQLQENSIYHLLHGHTVLSHHTDAIGIIQGIQVGRWGKKYLGAWNVNDTDKPTVFTSIGKDISEHDRYVEVHGGGMYCYLVATSLYKQYDFKALAPLGPDFWFGLSLHRQGYHNFVDLALRTGHRTAEEIIDVRPPYVCVTIEQRGLRYKETVKEIKKLRS
jgi:hypothetical protein